MTKTDLADARAEIARLREQVTRLQTDSTEELLKHRGTVIAKDTRIAELTQALEHCATALARIATGEIPLRHVQVLAMGISVDWIEPALA